MDIGKCFRDGWGLFTKDIGPLLVGVVVAALVPAVIVAVTVVAGLMGISSEIERASQTGSTLDFADLGVSWGVMIGGLLAAAVFGIVLTPALYAGMAAGILRRAREQRAMEYSDPFRGFRWWLPIVLAYLLLGVFIPVGIYLIPVLVVVAAIAADAAALALLAFPLFLVAICVIIYLTVRWAYVYLLIIDQQMGIGAAMGESNRLVKASGWWMTFLALLVVGLVVGAVNAVLGMIPYLGAVVGLVVVPFMFTYVVSMYLQARGEGGLVDAAIGYAPPAPAGQYPPPAPYGAAPPPPPGAPAPPSPTQADWSSAADPLAQPAAAAPQPTAPPPPAGPQAGVPPAVDAGSGQMQRHCSQCGTLIEGSSHFCAACAAEVSGGEPPAPPSPPSGGTGA